MEEKINALNNDADTVAKNLARQLRTDFFTRVLPSLSTQGSFYGTESYLYQATVGVGKTFQMVQLIGMIIEYDLWSEHQRQN